MTSDVHQPTYGGAENDGLLVKFDSIGNRVWATYFGGTGNDAIYTITCDDSNDVYVAGSTNSTNGITTVGTHEEVYDNKVEGFVTKFNGDGERLWGSYIRGGWAGGIGLATDPFNHLYLCFTAAIGAPDSFIFTENCHQATTSIGSENAFLIQFNSENGSRNWGTYYGAESRSDGLSVAADTLGNVYFSGTTNSFASITTESIATDGSYQDTLCAPEGTVSPPDDAFVVLFDSTGKRKWASYFGGPDTETGEIAYAPNGTLYLAGMTASSTGITTPNVYQSALGGDGDVFIVRWLPNDINLQAILSPVNDTVCAGAHPFSVQVKNQGRMNKVDDLVISYNFTGPENGSGTFSFSDDLNVGAVDTFSLDDLTFAFPGEYNLTVYLHYTKDDQDKDNDTLQMVIMATNAVPVSEIEVNQVGTVMHFSNPSAQASDIFWWDFGDGNTSTEPSPSHQYAITGLYQITLVTSSFCGSDTATLEITGEGNSIEETYLEKNILIYPNPTKHMLYLKLSEGIDISSYRIINILGQEVMAGRLDSYYRINVSGLPSGSYFIQVQSQRGLLRQKFQVLIDTQQITSFNSLFNPKRSVLLGTPFWTFVLVKIEYIVRN